MGGLSSVEEIEQLRRSVAMLAPRHPAALDRELALDILAELQRLQRRERHFSEAIQLARKVLDESDPDRPPEMALRGSRLIEAKARLLQASLAILVVAVVLLAGGTLAT